MKLVMIMARAINDEVEPPEQTVSMFFNGQKFMAKVELRADLALISGRKQTTYLLSNQDSRARFTE
jgi:hypothetical protein